MNKKQTNAILTAIIIAFVILYLISPIDLIPDIIPVIGWIDDAGVGVVGMWLLNYIQHK